MHIEQKWVRTFGRFKGHNRKREASKGRRRLAKKDIQERKKG